VLLCPVHCCDTVTDEELDKRSQGYNACIIAYGQTGTGKTHTMDGEGSERGRGIIPRAIEDIYSHIENDSAANSKFLVRASYFQIYNEASLSSYYVCVGIGIMALGSEKVLCMLLRFGGAFIGAGGGMLTARQVCSMLILRLARSRHTIMNLDRMNISYGLPNTLPPSALTPYSS